MMTDSDRAVLAKRLGNADLRFLEDGPPGVLEVQCRVGDWCHTVGVRSIHDLSAPGEARTEALEMAALGILDRAPHLFPVA